MYSTTQTTAKSDPTRILVQKPALIISGGQTGGDEGSLKAAEILGIPTSGYMPKGFRTETGPRPDLAKRFNLIEHSSPLYPPRTRENVEWACATLIVVRKDAPERGSRLTAEYCTETGRPYYFIASDLSLDNIEMWSYGMRAWLVMLLESKNYPVDILNGAGNRESVSPGIEAWTTALLVDVFS